MTTRTSLLHTPPDAEEENVMAWSDEERSLQELRQELADGMTFYQQIKQHRDFDVEDHLAVLNVSVCN